MPFGPLELVIILAIVILIFGASRIGKLGGALGTSIREFKEAKDAGEANDTKLNSTATPTAAPKVEVEAPKES